MVIMSSGRGRKRGRVDERSPSVKRTAGEAFGSEVDIDGAISPAELVVYV
jgi:hypothetical protein